MQFSYETLGNSSYLVATFEGGAGVVNYQLQMLANNDIKNIIKANKRQKNEDVLVSYNITSKIALAQLDIKTKIPKLGLIKIIEGAMAALEDLEEYQLVSSGLVLDEEYIFVKPGSFEPSFIYLPASMEDSGIEPLKQFLISLVVNSKVEISNDNFVQVLLETLNDPALTTKTLKKLCDQYKTETAPKAETKKVAPVRVEPACAETPASAVPQQLVQQAPPKAAPIPQVERKMPPQVSGSNPQKKKPEKKKADKKETKKEGTSKTKFLIFQVVFVGLLAAVVLSGVLNDANGNLNMRYLFGVVLALGCADFVLYRELFSNKKDDEQKQKEKTPKKEAKKPAMAMPGKEPPARPAMPGKDPVKPQVTPMQQPSAPVNTDPQPIVQNIPQPAVQNIPRPTYVATQSAQSSYSEFESEDTVVLDDSNSDGAYLEYYENGLLTKIKLNKANMMIGKLRGQCDFVLNNNKISKIHAEFITRNGEFFVKDYNSTNGTYINGSDQRIASNAEYQIFNGDRITLANIDMTFRC